MERVPRVRAQNREKAQTNVTLKTEIVDRKVKVAWEPAGDRVREQARAAAAVRVANEKRGKAAGGKPEIFSYIVVVKKTFRYSSGFSYNHLYQPEYFYEKRYKYLK